MTTKDTLIKMAANQDTIISKQNAILAALESGAGGFSDAKEITGLLNGIKSDTGYLVADTKETTETPTAQAPAITGLSPAGGSVNGGDTVTLTGTGFTGATEVTFGGVSVTPTVASDTSATFVTPAGAAGSVDVVIKTPAGSSAAVPFTVA